MALFSFFNQQTAPENENNQTTTQDVEGAPVSNTQSESNCSELMVLQAKYAVNLIAYLSGSCLLLSLPGGAFGAFLGYSVGLNQYKREHCDEEPNEVAVAKCADNYDGSAEANHDALLGFGLGALIGAPSFLVALFRVGTDFHPSDSSISPKEAFEEGAEKGIGDLCCNRS